MKDLLDLLDSYDLASISKVPQVFRRFGRRRLRALLEDLVAYSDGKGGRAQETQGLTLAPIGGSMGLGSAFEVAHETALYADHLILRNDLALLARRLLPHIDEGNQKEYESKRAAVLNDLYPYINQYLLIRPLWERGMASFAYPEAPAVLKDIDDDIKKLFLSGVSLQRTPKGAPWFSISIGGSHYTITPKMAIKGLRLGVVNKLWASTREQDAMMNQAMTYGDGSGDSQPEDPLHLLDMDHPLASQFAQLVRDETGRLEAALEICLASKAHFLTNQNLELSIVSGITAGEDLAESTPAATYDLAEELAFIREIPLEGLLELRESLASSFEIARGSLLRLSRDLTKLSSLDARKLEAARLVREEVQPALAALSEEIRGHRLVQAQTSAAAIGVASLSVLVAWVMSTPAALLGAGGSMPFLGRLLGKLEESGKERLDPMYFLLKVKEQSKG